MLRPNPSIERTSPGKPGAASHVKRWTDKIKRRSNHPVQAPKDPVMPIARANALFEKLDGRLTGIRLYGIAPPKLASDPDKLREIAAQQVARLRILEPEGLVVYDVQDEPGRAGQARPFPFLPTVDPEVYAYDALVELPIPKIVYRNPLPDHI
jgi:hypothetical protein